MEKVELTEDEFGRIVLLSAIPFIITALAVFFLYMSPIRNSLSDVDFERIFIYVFSIFFLLFLPLSFIAFSLTFEILYHTKIRKSFIFHVKRFVGRVILSAVVATLFTATTNALYILLSPFLGVEHVVRVALIAGSLVIVIAVWKFKHFFGRLEKGEW